MKEWSQKQKIIVGVIGLICWAVTIFLIWNLFNAPAPMPVADTTMIEQPAEPGPDVEPVEEPVTE